MEILGSELFVKALKEEKVDTLFAYPGGMSIDLFDALYQAEGLHIILPRHEQGLIHAADGYARSTGKVGVCLVTSGPGATNLVTGIATANFDSVPLVCFTGQVLSSLIGNDAFQEVDMVGISRSICKYAVTVKKREDLGPIIKKAFYIARTGKPGPVIVDIPKDLQQQLGSDFYPQEISIRGYKPNTDVHIGQLKKAIGCLEKANKPIFLIGGGVNVAAAGEELTLLSEKSGIPVVTTIMGKGAIPSDHPNYVGNIGMHGNYAANHAVSECDVLFSIGTRFNDRITGTVDTFAPNAEVIHVDIDPASISRNIKVDIPIVADAKIAISKMLELVSRCEISGWKDQIDQWKKEYPLSMKQYSGMTPETIISKINEMFDEAIIVTDVGQNQLWATQYVELTAKKKLLTSGGLGTMGYGFPAAIGAKIGNPDKPVICITGDGGMQMNIQELATAVTLEIPVIVCILNNGYLGNVRQWQEMFYDRRYSCTCLRHRNSCAASCGRTHEDCPPYTPDFIKVAEGYDALGLRVRNEEEISGALEKARENVNSPTLIEFIIEEEANVYPIVPGGHSLRDMVMD